jgi:DeoR/GlpR family transcriptional regulator of sugar metabolism
MLTTDRHQQIIDVLRAKGSARCGELSRLLGVSEDTVRRDLQALSEAGFLVKVHGGAVPRSTTKIEYAERSLERRQEKRLVAARAVAELKPRQVVFFDAGTTVLEAARALPRGLALTAITHSPVTAATLAELPEVEVILIGGRMRRAGLLAVGPETVDGYRRVRADICLLGICAVHVESGITDPSYDETLVKQAMIAAASELVVLGTGDKLGNASSFTVASSDSIDKLITDASAPASVLTEFSQRGIQVCVAT